MRCSINYVANRKYTFGLFCPAIILIRVLCSRKAWESTGGLLRVWTSAPSQQAPAEVKYPPVASEVEPSTRELKQERKSVADAGQ